MSARQLLDLDLLSEQATCKHGLAVEVRHDPQEARYIVYVDGCRTPGGVSYRFAAENPNSVLRAVLDCANGYGEEPHWEGP